MRAAGVAIAALFCAGCGRYAEFTLPPLPGGDPRLTFTFVQQAEPVLPRGDTRDVLNPAVVGDAMFYSEFDGRTWRTAHAYTKDRVHWTASNGGRLAPDPHTWEGDYIAANGTALASNLGEVSYWYVGGPKGKPHIGLAWYKTEWRKHPKPVLDPGPYGSWDEEGVADPYVIKIDDYFYLYFLGQDRARRQRLGVARSTDGIHWRKLRSNPILELGNDGAFDENGLGEPAVWSSHGFYWMLYTGRDRAENRRLGLTRSTDGVHWSKLPAVFSGAAPWDSKVICDPTLDLMDVKHGDEIRVWFGGGNVASPDENLNGQIGFGTLRATLGQ